MNRFLIPAALACFSFNAAAVPTFYTDLTSFQNQLSSSTTIDFEGIVADNEYGTVEGGAFDVRPSTVVDGVTFSVSAGTLAVSGKDGPVDGSPYDSALLFSNNGNPITVDLTSAGTGFTSIGGFFGDINSSGSLGTLSLFGSSGLLDVQNIIAADMGFGTPSNFFGWTVDTGDVTKVVFDLNEPWEGIDNLVYGTTTVPEPSIVWLLGSGLALIGFVRRRA